MESIFNEIEKRLASVANSVVLKAGMLIDNGYPVDSNSRKVWMILSVPPTGKDNTDANKEIAICQVQKANSNRLEIIKRKDIGNLVYDFKKWYTKELRANQNFYIKAGHQVEQFFRPTLMQLNDGTLTIKNGKIVKA
jgi:hypothetical protein